MKILLFLTLVLTNTAIAKGKRFLPNSFQAEFGQSYVNSFGKEKKSSGEIKYLYPSNIILETEVPEKIVYVANKKKTWYYTAPFMKDSPGELVVRPADSKNLSRFFDTLHSGLISNKNYKVQKKSKKLVTLSFLKEMKKILGVKNANIHFKSNIQLFTNIEKIILEYMDGNKVTISLKKLDVKVKLASEVFLFTAPKNTNISN